MATIVISKKNQKNIRGAMRRLWIFSDERREALRLAHVGKGLYICSKCRYFYEKKLVEVYHINPIGALVCYHEFITKLFCHEDNLSVLCKTCHAGKTAGEATTRAKKKRSAT